MQILVQWTWELTLWLKNFFILGTEVKEELIQLMSGEFQFKYVCLQRQKYSTIKTKGWKHPKKKLLPFQNSSGVIRAHHHPLSIKTTELFDMSGSGEGKEKSSKMPRWDKQQSWPLVQPPKEMFWRFLVFQTCIYQAGIKAPCSEWAEQHGLESRNAAAWTSDTSLLIHNCHFTFHHPFP